MKKRAIVAAFMLFSLTSAANAQNDRSASVAPKVTATAPGIVPSQSGVPVTGATLPQIAIHNAQANDCNNVNDGFILIEFDDIAFKKISFMKNFPNLDQAYTYVGSNVQTNVAPLRLVSRKDACIWLNGFLQSANDNKKSAINKVLFGLESSDRGKIAISLPDSAVSSLISANPVRHCDAAATSLARNVTLPIGGAILKNNTICKQAESELRCDVSAVCSALGSNQILFEKLLTDSLIEPDGAGAAVKWTSNDLEASNRLLTVINGTFQALTSESRPPSDGGREEDQAGWREIRDKPWFTAMVVFFGLLVFGCGALLIHVLSRGKAKGNGAKKTGGVKNSVTGSAQSPSGTGAVHAGELASYPSAPDTAVPKRDDEKEAIVLLVQILGLMMQNLGYQRDKQFDSPVAAPLRMSDDNIAQRLFLMVREWDSWKAAQSDNRTTQLNDIYRQFDNQAQEMEADKISAKEDIHRLRDDVENLKASVERLTLEISRISATQTTLSLPSAPYVTPTYGMPSSPANKTFAEAPTPELPTPNRGPILKFLKAVLPHQETSEIERAAAKIANSVAPDDHRNYVVNALTAVRNELLVYHKNQRTTLKSYNQFETTKSALNALILGYHQSAMLEVDDTLGNISTTDADNHLGDVSTTGVAGMCLPGLRVRSGGILVQPIYFSN
jgi:hypothetical protein